MKKRSLFIAFCIIIIFITVLIICFISNKSIRLNSLYDSLVYIEAKNDEYIDIGSGFVYKTLKNKNYILTNYHVVKNSSEIYVYNKNDEFTKATLIKYDVKNDIAMLTIDDKLNLKNVVFANSDNLKLGDCVYVMGNPIDNRYFGTLTKGIVSFLGRKISISKENPELIDTIQIDAAINPGSSGSMLLDKNGKVVGMVFVKEEDIDGIGFAITSNTIKKFIK